MKLALVIVVAAALAIGTAAVLVVGGAPVAATTVSARGLAVPDADVRTVSPCSTPPPAAASVAYTAPTATATAVGRYDTGSDLTLLAPMDSVNSTIRIVAVP
jgi:hypothetical protein